MGIRLADGTELSVRPENLLRVERARNLEDFFRLEYDLGLDLGDGRRCNAGEGLEPLGRFKLEAELREELEK